MNLNQSPTTTELKQLILQCDDNASDHIIWVDHHGNVKISPLQNLLPNDFSKAKNIKFRLETCVRGHELVGPTAANDKELMEDVFKTLVKLWNENYISCGIYKARPYSVPSYRETGFQVA